MSEDRDELIERVAAELRSIPAAGPELTARVMDAVRAEPRPGSWRAVWADLARPREVRVSPLGGLALAAGVAGLVFGAAVLGPTRQAAPQVAGRGTRPDSLTPVQFVLVAPDARNVALVGDFNDWDVRAQPLQQASEDGVWTVTVPLAPGRYRYTFLVNGERWITDPAAPTAREDDFGRPNSIITVAGKGS